MKRIYEFTAEEVAKILVEHLRDKGDLGPGKYKGDIKVIVADDGDGFTMRMELEAVKK